MEIIMAISQVFSSGSIVIPVAGPSTEVEPVSPPNPVSRPKPASLPRKTAKAAKDTRVLQIYRFVDCASPLAAMRSADNNLPLRDDGSSFFLWTKPGTTPSSVLKMILPTEGQRRSMCAKDGHGQPVTNLDSNLYLVPPAGGVLRFGESNRAHSMFGS